MIKTLKGHPHNYSQLELEDIDNLSKEQFIEGSELVDEEEIPEESELEERIKENIQNPYRG